MTIKSILCLFNGMKHERTALDTALQLTARFKAETRCLHVSVPLNAYPELYGFALYGQAMGGAGDVLETLAKDNEEQRAEAYGQVVESAKRHDVALTPGGPADQPTVSFLSLSALYRECLPKLGRVSDLIVIGLDSTPGADLTAGLTALFDTGRPVLFVPTQDEANPAPAKTPKTIAIAWDGSRQAARAVHDALPFLEQADKVELFCVTRTGDTPDSAVRDDILRYLQSHGVKADFATIRHDDSTLPEAILARASAIGADWLVMGAYGHSHIGEMVLGGATNHILKHAPMPILMAH